MSINPGTVLTFQYVVHICVFVCVYKNLNVKHVDISRLYVCGKHSPYSIPLVKCRDHGSWMLRHQSYQQLEHIMDILVLQGGKITNKE